ncbi:MAG: DUF937 domain-containing protein, partial [Bacteroidota bacterium]
MDLTSLLKDQLQGQLSGGLMDMLSNQMGGGVSRQQTASASNSIISVLLSAMARNAATPAGAESLNNALERDNHGGLLDSLTDLVGGGMSNNRAANGSGILKHILGRRTDDTVAQIGQRTGMSTGNVMQLMTTLAPVVMGVLGRTKQTGGLNADGLGGLLDGFMRESVQPQRPARETNIGLGGLLDRDGDGSAIDDIAGMIG